MIKQAKFLIFCVFLLTVVPVVAQGNAPNQRRVINDADLVPLPGTVHPLAQPRFDAGLANPSDRMERMILMLSLRPGAERELEALIQQQHDPRSALYQQWLTPDQFGAAFGISDDDLNTIAEWLQDHGFTVDEVARSRRWINFSGSVGLFEQVFHTEMHLYFVKGELHHANSKPPSIPRALGDLILGFVSLHDFYKKPLHTSAKAVPPEFTSGSSHYLAPGDFATIYNVNPLYGRTPAIDGTGQTVAVVARSNINHSDPTTFRSYFGLPANDPNYIINGTDPGLVGGPKGGEVTEANLDVQWAGAIAYNVTVDMVISESTSTTDGVDLSAQYIVDHNLAPIMTTSFGLCEQDLGSGNTFYANLWAQAASQGITPFVSSGDSGAAGCDSGSANTGTQLAINGLCSPANSVCVGGTQFMDTSNPSLYWSASNSANHSSALSYIPEQVWNESGSVSGGSGLWASGGGASTLYAKPTWQFAPGVPNDSVRDVPDVSLSAAGHDGYLVYQGGKLYSVGGTSASSPSFASLLALVVQQSGARQGNANTVFYPMGNNQYAGSGAPTVFHDTTTGNNTVPGVTGYNAVTGFDLATGLGSVDVTQLVLNWGVPDFSISGPASATVQQASSVPVTITTTVFAGFSAPLSLSATGLPSGVTVSFNPSSISAPGDGTSTVTITASANAPVGTVSITVTATGEGKSHSTTLGLTINVSGTPASMLSPANGSTLTGSTATFTWDTGTGVSAYYLWVGTAPGTYSLVNFGSGTATSYTANNLPTNGSTLYARLWSSFNGVLQYNDYTYTAATLAKAGMLTPTPGTVLPAATVTFTWDSGTSVSAYYLWVGTSPGTYNLVNFGGGSATSYTANNLPTNGSTLYARLWSKINGVLQYNDYTYTAAMLAKAVMITPTPGTVLPGATVTFTWDSGTGVSAYYLWVGTSPGTYNLVNFGGGAATSYTANSLPTNGSTLYVRLWSKINGVLQYNDYSYTAATIVKAAMVSPTPGAMLPANPVTFTWTLGTASTTYLWVGTAVGTHDLVNFGGAGDLSYTATNLPTNGSAVYVRLWSNINGELQYIDYTYTAATVIP